MRKILILLCYPHDNTRQIQNLYHKPTRLGTLELVKCLKKAPNCIELWHLSPQVPSRYDYLAKRTNQLQVTTANYMK